MLSERYKFDDNFIIREVEAGKYRGTTRIHRCPDQQGVERDPSHSWWRSFLRGERVQSNGKEDLRIVDLFSGSGGLSLGAQEAAIACGLRPRMLIAVDMDAEAIEVYRRNFTPIEVGVDNVASLVDYHIYGRAQQAELAYLPELLAPKLSRLIGKVDLLVAGPPCQGHSNLNNRTRRDDPRNQLYVATVAIGIALNVKALVIENVPEVVNDSTDVVQTARTVLITNGYKVSDGVLSAQDLGGVSTVPIKRRKMTIRR